MSEYLDWQAELEGAQLVDGRWVRPGRPALTLLRTAAALLTVALLAAALVALPHLPLKVL